jgi:hypothetical protein
MAPLPVDDSLCRFFAWEPTRSAQAMELGTAPNFPIGDNWLRTPKLARFLTADDTRIGATTLCSL